MRNIRKILIVMALTLCGRAAAQVDVTLPPLHVEGNQLVTDAGKAVTLHGVMDTPNPFFNNYRWGYSCNRNNVAKCIDYFDKLCAAMSDHSQGAYSNLLRLCIDACWINDPNKTDRTLQIVVDPTLCKDMTFSDGYDPNTYTVEKTPEEKAAILTNALESWVSTVVSLYADSVSGWDVVAMPLSIDSLASDFYWQDYLGMTQYVARAFNAARKAGGKNLFIADRYDKAAQLKALADNALASGAEIDGYDLVIDCTDLDKPLLTEALSLLAQTGKLIRLSSVSLPAAADYSFVVSSYVKSVPAQQRHGISLKTMSPLWTTAKTRSLIYGAIAESLE